MGISLKAIWNNKCPRCRKGTIFTEPFRLSKPLDMPTNCEVCGQKTEPEPGFYFGAMFLSYIISGWLMILPALLLVFYFGFSAEAAMGVIIVIALFTYIKFLRGSRVIWLHLMVKYDPKTKDLAMNSTEKNQVEVLEFEESN